MSTPTSPDSALEPLPRAIDAIAPRERRDTNAITSRLVLEYANLRGGRAAVDQLLRRAGAEELEQQLRDENYWFSYDLKARLFNALADVFDDPNVMLHMGQVALDLNVGGGLKLALRALGSPRLVYQNIVRANAAFTRSHRMDLRELRSDYARVAFVNLIGVDFEPLDCQYNLGLLACIPQLFGQPPARIAHPHCAGDGGDECVYEISWEARGSYTRYSVAWGAVSAAALAAAAALEPALLPAAGAISALGAAASLRRIASVRRARWRQLEIDAQANADMTERLMSSLQELASELRGDEVLAKVTAHASAAVSGKEFVLLLREGDRLAAEPGCGVDDAVIASVAAWAERTGRLTDDAVLLDDAHTAIERAGGEDAGVGSLCAAPLVYRGEPLGVLVALDPHARAFLPRDVDLIRSYAAQAAIALGNARLYEAQQALARRDPLTGLLNHREFHESVARERARDERFSILLLDLDGFKAVNDESGHAAGDDVLKKVAGALDAVRRDGDAGFRVGGDEFAVVMPGAAPAQAETIGRRLQEGVAAADRRVGASFGVVTYPDDGDGADVLLAEADRRLYVMKRPASRGRPASSALRALSEAVLVAGVAPAEHAAAVCDLCERVGRRLRLSESELQTIRDAAALHDAPKLAVTHELLDTPRRLDEDERRQLESQLAAGAALFERLPELAPVHEIVRSIHERFDGSGYPLGLARDAIPLGARIVAACEALDSMTRPRPYAPQRSLADAIAELDQCAGSQFDPQVVAALVAALAYR